MTIELALCGEAWGESETRLGHPFVGTSGVELLRMLDDSGLMPLTTFDKSMIASFWNGRDSSYVRLVWRAHPEVHLTNVFNFRPDLKNDILALCGPKATAIPGRPALRQGKYIRNEFAGEVARLAAELRDLKPNLVIALGNTAAWALLNNSGITKIRGAITPSTLVENLKVLPTFHPAAILRQWEYRPVTVLDFQKAYYEKSFPEIRRPKRVVFVEPDLPDLDWFYENHVRTAEFIAPDIETAGGQITCIGFATSPSVALVVPFVDYRREGNSYWPTLHAELQAWGFVRRVLGSPIPKIFQNGLYDLHFLWRAYGLTTANALHDTMLLSHSLQPESPKSLGFLAACYSNEAAWKLWRGRGKAATLKREDE